MRLFLFLILFSALPAADRCAPLPPDANVLRGRAHGCAIRQAAPPDTYWYVRVWSDNELNQRWEALYSARPADELRKALGDCDVWLDCVRQRRKALERKPS